MGIRKHNIAIFTIAATAAALMSSCGGGLPATDLGRAGKRNNLAQAAQYSNLDQMLPEGNFIEAVYDVKASSGILVNCKGTTKFNVTTRFVMKMLDSNIDCGLFGKMDLASSMAGMDPRRAEAEMGDMSRFITNDGTFIRTTRLPSFEFYPARPMVVSAINLDLSKITVGGPGVVETFTARDLRPNIRTIREAIGTATYTVLGKNEVASVPNISKPFQNIFRWKLQYDGFAGIDRMASMLFNSMEVSWNMAPLAIPKISIVTRLENVLAGAANNDSASMNQMAGQIMGSPIGGVADFLVGEIKIDLTLSSQVGL